MNGNGVVFVLHSVSLLILIARSAGENMWKYVGCGRLLGWKCVCKIVLRVGFMEAAKQKYYLAFSSYRQEWNIYLKTFYDYYIFIPKTENYSKQIWIKYSYLVHIIIVSFSSTSNDGNDNVEDTRHIVLLFTYFIDM